MSTTDFDFSRYAPDPPSPVADPAAELLAADGELAELGRTMRFALAVACTCIANMLVIIRQRIWRWVDTRIIHSLRFAWVFAGFSFGTALVGVIFSISILG